MKKPSTKVLKKQLNIKFKELLQFLEQTSINVVASDSKSKSILVTTNNNLNILLTFIKDGSVLHLENSIHFPVKILNLKTISTISNAAYASGVSITGVSVVNINTSRFYLGKEIPYPSSFVTLSAELDNIVATIAIIESYITLRLKQSMLSNIDISMFKDIDISLIDTLRMGEKKDFMYKNWDSFLESREKISFASENEEILAKIIVACKDFEQKNNLLLSEVGDVLWDELVSNFEIMASLEDLDFAVN